MREAAASGANLRQGLSPGIVSKRMKSHMLTFEDSSSQEATARPTKSSFFSMTRRSTCIAASIRRRPCSSDFLIRAEIRNCRSDRLGLTGPIEKISQDERSWL